jgi:integrator complex subunit 1
MNYNKSHSNFQIRQTVITKLEMWIMNPKIFRPAQDLLLSVAVNCTTHSPADVEVIGNFTKLRFKNKPNINLYLVKKISQKLIILLNKSSVN